MAESGNERVRTPEGMPVGGWVLRADLVQFDPRPMIEEFGQVFRYPLEESERSALMRPGQPCFLFVADRSKVVGIWAVGEVVAETHRDPIDPDDPGSGSQVFAELELLPLAKPISAGRLQEDNTLAASELFTDPGRPNPTVLQPHEVRALEEFDFTTVEPTDAQIARLDEVLGEEAAGGPVGSASSPGVEDDEAIDLTDLDQLEEAGVTGVLFQLVGVDQSFGIRLDDDPDGLFSVFTVNHDGAFELGRFAGFADALSLIALRAADLELAPPVDPPDDPDDLPEGNPAAILRTEDGILAIYRTGPEDFDLYDPDRISTDADDDGWGDDDEWDEVGPLLGRYERLGDVLEALADAVEDDDEDRADILDLRELDDEA